MCNVVTEQITLSRVSAQQDPAVIGRLAALVGKTPAQIQAAIADQQYSLYKPVPILNDAPPADILYIKEHQSEFPGVTSIQTTQRTYPQVELPGPAQGAYPAAQVLGYVGTINSAELKARAAQGYVAGDDFGQSGLEFQYEAALRGTPGSQQLEVDPSGQVAGVLKTVPSKPGDNIVTNIDTNLQQVADNALATQVQNLKRTYDPSCLNASGNKVGCYPQPTGGAVVVMSPQTGAVYAMSSYPSYNPSVWVGGISQADYAALSDPANNVPLLNRAIQGLYTPGSTFKLNTATAALQSGLITPTTPFNDTGTYKTPDCQYQSTTCIFHDSAGDAAGTYNVSSALTVSSDAFFYNLGYEFYAQHRPVRADADPGPGRPVQPGPADRHRPAGRGPGPGRQPGRPGQAPRRGPEGLPQHHLVHRRQHRDGLRPGRHLHHPDRAGRGLQHVRQRRHPLRPPGGRRRGVADREGGEEVRPPGHRATWPCRPRPTRPC